MSLDTQDIQLLFVDLQSSFVSSSRTLRPEAIAAAAGVLAKAGEILQCPMTFTVVPEAGKPGAMIPELAAYAGGAVSRTVTSPFLEPAIVSKLAASGRKTIVVAGFSVEVAVLQTSLDAIDAGYAVQVPVDAVGSRSERTEAAAFRQIERAGAVTTSVRSLLLRLTPDLSRPPGSLMLRALAALQESLY